MQFSVDELVGAESVLTKQLPENQTLFNLGDECSHYVIVQTGMVRVELLSTMGQHLLLYRIQEGQSCIMTTSCLMGNSRYFAQAISETPVELILIPQAIFHTNLKETLTFREFVFNNFSERLAVMLDRTADLAICSVDQRLSAVLLAHINPHNKDHLISLTHEQLAIEIGSAREVVSRRLSQFEKIGLVEKQRGFIRIIDPEKLSLLLAS